MSLLTIELSRRAPTRMEELAIGSGSGLLAGELPCGLESEVPVHKNDADIVDSHRRLASQFTCGRRLRHGIQHGVYSTT